MNWEEPEYNGPYPLWGRIIGWLISVSCVIWIPVYIIYEFCKAEGGFQQVRGEMRISVGLCFVCLTVYVSVCLCLSLSIQSVCRGFCAPHCPFCFMCLLLIDFQLPMLRKKKSKMVRQVATAQILLGEVQKNILIFFKIYY